MRGIPGDGDQMIDSVDVEGATKDGNSGGVPEKAAKSAVKRDFFGRPIVQVDAAGNGIADVNSSGYRSSGSMGANAEGRVWVTYHEGYSNAVKKGITMKELLEGL